MSLAYALPFFCDMMLYFGILGCMGLLRRCRAELMWVPAMLLAACWLSHRLSGHKRRWLRWAPMAVAVPCLIAAGNWPGRLAALPMLVFLPLYVSNNRKAPDYDYAADHFRHSLIVAGFFLLLAALLRAGSYKRGLPFLFLYFTLNMALLRLLRHDDAVARSRRFRFLNLAGVALACAAGFALSQPVIVAAIAAAWGWFAENVLYNLLAVALFALQMVLYAGAWLLSRLFGDPSGEPGAALANMTLQSDRPNLADAAMQTHALPAWAQFAIQAAGILLLAAGAFWLLRALSRRVAREALPSGSDEREALDDVPAAPRARGLRREPQAGVRKWYRKALMLLRARGGRVTRTMNTLQIQQANARLADEEALAGLRALYLPVRYGKKPADQAAAAQARAAYERLRRG